MRVGLEQASLGSSDADTVKTAKQQNWAEWRALLILLSAT
jgi:hypothetical protein